MGVMTVGSGGSSTILLRSAPRVSIGAITGRVQTLSNRAGLRFNLYDTLFDKAVACYLALGQEEFMREAWGQRDRVSIKTDRSPLPNQGSFPEAVGLPEGCLAAKLSVGLLGE